MNTTINCTKRIKVRDDNKDCLQALHNVCNWSYLDKPAIEYRDLNQVKIISYNELQMAKNVVSNHLKGINHTEFIGINFDISEYCVPSLMLGILESGHAFFNVPMDPLTYKEIFISLHVKYIFTNYTTANREVICRFDIHERSIYLMKLINVQENITNENHFAYAIATSGSTGIPKVVKVPHCCILPNITDLRRILDVTNSDKIAQLTSHTFDPSIVEIFLSLCCAATLFMVSKLLKNEASRLLEEISHARVTILQITPSLFFYKWSSERLKATILDKDSKLRVLLFGGEPFPNMKLLSESSHLQNMTRLFNIYGITEISCWSSINEIIKDNDVDESYLGKPLLETIFQIRNENNEVITKGEGNLYIGSASRICIVGNEIEKELNKPVFRDTGDVVSIDDHGRIFYRGRRNNIVKRFGNKVNLRELERVAMELNFVRNCAAFWDAKNHKLYLCLSTTKTKEFSILNDDIMSHLKILPSIYKPDKIIKIEHFNFTNSGKICHASLKKICRESETEVISVNDLHANASKIFERFWNDHIKSKNEGFLMSGGTSIAALQISSAVAETFDVEFPELIGMLLKDSTFDKCVNYIRSNLIEQSRSKDVGHIDVSLDCKLPQNIFDTGEPSIKQSLLDERNQWYKCRGKTYGDTLIREQSKAPSRNISSIDVITTYNLQKCIDASPTVYRYSETELYATVGSHSGIIRTVNLLKIDDISYEVKLPDRIEASVLVLADFRGIVGCYDGYIYCINLKTDEVIWKYQTQDMVKCTAITCTEGSKIFVGSYDHHVYCLSTEGVEIWKTKASQGGICATGCLHPQTSSILFGTLDGSCLALRQSSGEILWKRKLRDSIFVAPIVLRTGHTLFCPVSGTLCCFDIETDCQLWRYVIHGNVFSYPVIWSPEATNNEFVVLASHNKNLYCLEMPRRTTRENVPRLRCILQLHSPIFATSWCEDEYMFVTCTDGTFKVFRLPEGELLATKRLPGETFSSPVVHDGIIVLGCRDNNLYVMKLNYT